MDNFNRVLAMRTADMQVGGVLHITQARSEHALRAKSPRRVGLEFRSAFSTSSGLCH